MTSKTLNRAMPLTLLMLAASAQTAVIAGDYPPPPGPYRSGPYTPTTPDQGRQTDAAKSLSTGLPHRPGMLMPADPARIDSDNDFDASTLFGAAPPEPAAHEPMATSTPPVSVQEPTPRAEHHPNSYLDTMPWQTLNPPASPTDPYAQPPTAGSDFSVDFRRSDAMTAPPYGMPYQHGAAGYAGFPPEQAPPFAPAYAPEYAPGMAPNYAPSYRYGPTGAPFPPAETQDGYYPVYPEGYASDANPPKLPADSGGFAPGYEQPYYATGPQGQLTNDPTTPPPGDMDLTTGGMPTPPGGDAGQGLIFRPPDEMPR